MLRNWFVFIGLAGLTAAPAVAQDCPPPRRHFHHFHPPRVAVVESVPIVNLGARPQRAEERAREERAAAERAAEAAMLDQTKELAGKMDALEQRFGKLLGVLEQQATNVENINQRLRAIETKVLDIERNQPANPANKPVALRRIEMAGPPAN